MNKETEAIRKNMEQIGSELRKVSYTCNDFLKMCEVIKDAGIKIR